MRSIFYILCFLLSLTFSLQAQTGIEVPSMSHCDTEMENFLSTYAIPGATFAMARNGKLVYMRAFGDADLLGNENVYPHSIFRLASLSKPITSIGIRKLVEDGQLSLSEKVFGTGSILENHPYLSNANVTDQKIFDITVQHLLEHSAGWNRDVSCVPSPTSPYPWWAGHCDPIGFPLHVTQELNESNPVTEEMLIRFLMEKGTDFTPGTGYAYSNIGYLTLGLIIEEKTGMSYEDYMKTQIFAPIGVCDMHIGKNLLVDKLEREVEYQGNGFLTLNLYGTGDFVPWEYGGWNLEAMDAHGGWVGTARDLVRMILSVDGSTTVPDILNSTSINAMVAPSVNNPGYAQGWSVNQFNNWWHTGGLDGTATIMVRAQAGFVWAVLLNKRIINSNSGAFWSALDNLPWNCLSNTTTWPSHDLLLFPTTNSSDISFTELDDNSVTVSWANGNGDFRLLVAKEGSPVDRFPLDGDTYTASAFGLGSDLGDGNYVVGLESGSGNSVIVSNLASNTNYHFRIFEFNQNSATGNHPLYKLCGNEGADVSTLVTSIDQVEEKSNILVFPNPTRELLTIEVNHPVEEYHLKISDPSGKLLLSKIGIGHPGTLDVGHLPSGVHVIDIVTEKNDYKTRFVKL